MFCDVFHFTTLVGQNTLRTLVVQNPTNIKHPCLYSNVFTVIQYRSLQDGNLCHNDKVGMSNIECLDVDKF